MSIKRPVGAWRRDIESWVEENESCRATSLLLQRREEEEESRHQQTVAENCRLLTVFVTVSLARLF